MYTATLRPNPRRGRAHRPQKRQWWRRRRLVKRCRHVGTSHAATWQGPRAFSSGCEPRYVISEHSPDKLSKQPPHECKRSAWSGADLLVRGPVLLGHPRRRRPNARRPRARQDGRHRRRRLRGGGGRGVVVGRRRRRVLRRGLLLAAAREVSSGRPPYLKSFTQAWRIPLSLIRHSYGKGGACGEMAARPPG